MGPLPLHVSQEVPPHLSGSRNANYGRIRDRLARVEGKVAFYPGGRPVACNLALRQGMFEPKKQISSHDRRTRH